MLLASDTIDKASEFTQRQLDYASNVSFPAYAAVLIFLTVVAVLGIHLICFVRPDVKSRRECSEKLANSLLTAAATAAANVQIQAGIQEWLRAIDSRLSKGFKCPAAEIDRRENIADERERLADRRENVANHREDLADIRSYDAAFTLHQPHGAT